MVATPSWPGLSGPSVAAGANRDGPAKPGHDEEATSGPISTPMWRRGIDASGPGPGQDADGPAAGALFLPLQARFGRMHRGLRRTVAAGRSDQVIPQYRAGRDHTRAEG